MKKFEFRLPKV